MEAIQQARPFERQERARTAESVMEQEKGSFDMKTIAVDIMDFLKGSGFTEMMPDSREAFSIPEFEWEELEIGKKTRKKQSRLIRGVCVYDTETGKIRVETDELSSAEAIRLVEIALARISKPAIRIPFEEEKIPKLSYERAFQILKREGFPVEEGLEIPEESIKSLSLMFEQPFFLVEFPSELGAFHDREDPMHPEFLRNFELVCPDGLGRAAFGGEREKSPEKVMERLDLLGEESEKYRKYFEEWNPCQCGFSIDVEKIAEYLKSLN
ncbi:MAG: hypothetical protein NTV63_00045 [Candidatus Woesearchaeota archaeon]|nr:hypothetical protein [Candidatus Woesearchaeota archaeon]